METLNHFGVLSHNTFQTTSHNDHVLCRDAFRPDSISTTMRGGHMRLLAH